MPVSKTNDVRRADFRGETAPQHGKTNEKDADYRDIDHLRSVGGFAK
jgi:hypothetical protein